MMIKSRIFLKLNHWAEMGRGPREVQHLLTWKLASPEQMCFSKNSEVIEAYHKGGKNEGGGEEEQNLFYFIVLSTSECYNIPFILIMKIRKKLSISNIISSKTLQVLFYLFIYYFVWVCVKQTAQLTEPSINFHSCQGWWISV